MADDIPSILSHISIGTNDFECAVGCASTFRCPETRMRATNTALVLPTMSAGN